MTNSRRRTTVHDLAALRVHPDGTRVQNSDANLAARRAKYAVRDARGNWIAHDAAGLGTVKQRRSVSQLDPEDSEEGAPEQELEPGQGGGGVVAEDLPGPSRKDKGKARAAADEEEEVELELDSRTVKRRRFNEDLDFLAPRGSSAAVMPAPEEQPSRAADEGASPLPVPSAVCSGFDISYKYIFICHSGLAEMSALLCELVLHCYGAAVRRYTPAP